MVSLLKQDSRRAKNGRDIGDARCMSALRACEELTGSPGYREEIKWIPSRNPLQRDRQRQTTTGKVASLKGRSTQMANPTATGRYCQLF